MTKLQKAQVEQKRLWKLMCESEGINPDNKFVVFDPTNPIAAEYNKAVHNLFRLRSRSSLKAIRTRLNQDLAVR